MMGNARVLNGDGAVAGAASGHAPPARVRDGQERFEDILGAVEEHLEDRGAGGAHRRVRTRSGLKTSSG